jgi:hypothetical protein
MVHDYHCDADAEWNQYQSSAAAAASEQWAVPRF